jgi:hypothetical protein
MHQRGNALDGSAIGEMLVEIVHNGLEIFVGADDRARTVGISQCALHVLFLPLFSSFSPGVKYPVAFLCSAR